MKQRVRAIIIDQDQIILMARERDDREPYWVFPGGLVEEGEGREEALERECFEELGIRVAVGKLIAERELDLYAEKQKETFFLCQKISGRLGTGQGPEFSEYKEKGWGSHEVVEIPLDQLAEVNLLPKEIKKLIMDNKL